jgi:PTS system ascorbate-specific IIA component
MSGLFLIAHEPLASALKCAAQHCFPEAIATLQALDVNARQTPEEIEAQARILLQVAQDGDERGEVLILTDVFGATPCNTVQRLADGQRVKVVTGVNLPMLWRALNYSRESLDTLITRAVAGGSQGIMQIATSRPQNQATSASSHDQDHRHHQQ